jgi:glycosyltransferase involved in cell wall biosynthesis
MRLSLKAKVLHVINDLGIGGTQALLVKHICQLQAYPNIISEICVLGSRSKAHLDYLARLQVPTHFLDFSGEYRNPKASVTCIARLRRLVRERKPNLVHTYLWNADVFGAIAIEGLRVARVGHVVDRRGDRNASRLVARLRTRGTGWLMRRGIVRFVAVSHACRQHAIEQLRVAPHQVVTAHNGVELSDFAPVTKPVFGGRPFTFGTISRLVEEKGHRHLIEAFRMLAATGAPVRLKIAGSGSSLRRHQSIIEKLGLSDTIAFVGHVRSAASFLSGLDAFIIPSTHAEGLPTTILEAMASGLPVIATDVGGASEAISDGREGVIIRPNEPAAIVDAVHRLLSAPESASAMGRAGRKRVERDFTVETMTATIVEHVYAPLRSAHARI